jgi:uncharacterized protein (DUF952 family)
VIYKLLTALDWAGAAVAGRYEGSPVDHRDGFIHLSAADQVVQTAALHFAGQTSLVMLVVDPQRLGADLRWEVSRGGALFPHLYAPLPTSTVVEEHRLPDDREPAGAIADLLRAISGPVTPGSAG